MKAFSRFAALCLALMLLAGAGVGSTREGANAESLRHQVLYFYQNYCESCTPEEDFGVRFQGLTGLSLSECDFRGYNVVRAEGKAALDAAIEEYQLTDPRLPLVIVDGIAYVGDSQMSAQLAVEALEWSDTTDSEIVYLYVPACESCARVQAVLDGLPESVAIQRGEAEFESKVVVRKIDASADPALADALFEVYGVPDDERIAPSVFFARRYLSGADDEEQKLKPMVELGWASGGVLLAEPEAQADVLTLLGTVGAGLVAGLNTCALSMLLMFLSMLLEAKRRARGLAACFLLAKFACYLLIGFALLGVLQRFNPTWLRPLAKGLMTALGAALIALNLWDAWQAHRENFGKIRNQLPTQLRGALHRAIKALMHSRVLIPATIALGIIVALGEFLCAGQIYLMRLLSAVQSGASAQAVNLIAYCAAFIAPSAALCALILGGRSQAHASQFLAEHMSAVKIATASTMLLLILAAWLL
jgi:hypothetical protein